MPRRTDSREQIFDGDRSSFTIDDAATCTPMRSAADGLRRAPQLIGGEPLVGAIDGPNCASSTQSVTPHTTIRELFGPTASGGRTRRSSPRAASSSIPERFTRVVGSDGY